MNTLVPNSPSHFRAKESTITRRRRRSVSASLDDNQQQQVNVSVLRFTLGIPGFDESYLPRGIGYAFGSLLVLNHFVSPTTPAQLRTEALGLSLAVFSVAIPYLGKFLRGSSLVDQPILPEGNKQIFSLSEHVSGSHKEDLAWGSYVLLKNTNAMSVLLSVQGALCVRGYWNVPEDLTSDGTIDWFEREIQLFGLSDLNDALYFPRSEDTGIWKLAPKGTRSLLIQPVLGDTELSAHETSNKSRGFIFLASSISYAYSDRDIAWIGAVANKFNAKVACTCS